MSVTAAQVKELRQKTGVGMMECKKALTEVGGDIEKAILYLRERGMSRAAKKADRVTAEGLVKVAVSNDGKSATAVEVNCETDFVSKNDDFIKFLDAIANLALANNVNDVEALKALDLDGKSVGDTLTTLIATIATRRPTAPAKARPAPIATGTTSRRPTSPAAPTRAARSVTWCCRTARSPRSSRRSITRTSSGKPAAP